MSAQEELEKRISQLRRRSGTSHWSIYSEQYVAPLQTEAENRMNGQPLRAGSRHSCKNQAIVRDLTKAQTKLWNCQGKRSPTIEELDQAQATVKGLLAEYQEQLRAEAKAAYQEAQTAMFTQFWWEQE